MSKILERKQFDFLMTKLYRYINHGIQHFGRIHCLRKSTSELIIKSNLFSFILPISETIMDLFAVNIFV